MSRITLTRHPNGEEHVIVGWDRPLQHFFWSEYDDEGESIDESYINRNLRPNTTKALVDAAAADNRKVFLAIMDAVERGGQDGAPEVLVELGKHQTLDYPESNVELDLSVEKK